MALTIEKFPLCTPEDYQVFSKYIRKGLFLISLPLFVFTLIGIPSLGWFFAAFILFSGLVILIVPIIVYYIAVIATRIPNHWLRNIYLWLFSSIFSGAIISFLLNCALYITNDPDCACSDDDGPYHFWPSLWPLMRGGYIFSVVFFGIAIGAFLLNKQNARGINE